jgi:DNA-binding MarR family transcriptional regulator
MRLEEAIQQAKFQNEHQKAGVNILYTASWFSKELTRALRPHDISWQQFNIMRILRGQKGCPLPLKSISERMIDPMSNTSRLVDKLVSKGYVERKSDTCDRRQIAISLTASGQQHLTEASNTVDHLAHDLFGNVCNEELNQLNDLLDKIRSN